MMEWTLADLCERLHGDLIGDGATRIRGVNAFASVQQDELTYADTPRNLAHAITTPAAGIIVFPEAQDLGGRPGIRVPDPKLAFALLLELFYPEAAPPAGVHPTAVVGRNVRLGEGVSVQAHAVIADDVVIGRGSVVGAGVVIGAGVRMGERCLLDANVVLYRRTQLGDRVWIHAGSVIGGDGFGYVFRDGAYLKVPQVGNVVIEDDVEIGCNVCVDRSTSGSTLIRKGAKIDNLVQIAHNDRIGQHAVLAGQVGLSGSVTVGDYVVMGGKAGAIDHLTIGDRTQVGAASLVTKSLPPDATVWGCPARPLREAKQQMAAGSRLSSLSRALAKLAARLRIIEDRQPSPDGRVPSQPPPSG